MRLPKLLLPLAAVAAVGLPATAAQAVGYTSKDVWEVSAKVTQKTTWSLNHTESGTCDADQAGHGTETVRLRSKRTVRATTYQGGYPMFLASRKGFSLPMKGSVSRDGAIVTGPTHSDPNSCADGTGESQPPASDCGTKAVPTAFLEPQWDTKGKRIRLEETVTPLVPSFDNCPNMGTTWPNLLLNTKGRAVSQSLPFKELPEAGKHILIGTATEKGGDGESIYKTTIRWELTLKRVKHEDL